MCGLVGEHNILYAAAPAPLAGIICNRLDLKPRRVVKNFGNRDGRVELARHRPGYGRIGDHELVAAD